LRTNGERGDQCSFMNDSPPQRRGPAQQARRLRASDGDSA
jgi:hypothetical protein